MTLAGPAARPVTPLGILGELLTQVAAGSDDPRIARAAMLAGGLEPYLDAMTTPESPALAALAERTRAQPWEAPLEPEMLSGHVEGQLLRMLVRVSRARRVLDIGMFTGYSALAIAEALPAGGTVLACELDPEVADLARECFTASRHADRIDVRVGPAAETLATLEGTFDLVFLDADKAGYADYLDTLLDGSLLSENALICVDNTLLQGEPWTGERTANGEAIAAFNQRVAADPRVEQVLIPLRDGVTLIQRV